MEVSEDYYLKLAKLGYQAYGDKADWKNYQGLPMPTWETLPENIKTYWIAAVTAVFKEVAK